MMNYKYEVNTYMNGEEVILRTNNPRNAIHAFFEALEIGAHVNIVDGTTGEVLAIANCPDMDNYTTEEMALMMLGYLMEAEWGHAEAEEAECVDCEDEGVLAVIAEAVHGPLGAVLALPFGEGLPS